MGLTDVFAVATGAMISSGIFVLPGIAHAQAGPAVVLSYVFAGCIAAMGMLSLAETLTAMPKAGGGYFIVMRTMGPAVGTVAGLCIWFSLALKSAFALIGLAAFIEVFFEMDHRITGTVLCLVFLGVNLRGVREAAVVQKILVVFLCAALGVYIITGLDHVRPDHFLPFASKGWNAVFSTAGTVFVAYGGLLAVDSVAEETRNPGRTLPLGLFLSLIVVMILYSLAVFVTTGVLPSGELNDSLTPISDGARAFLGRPGFVLVSAAAVAAFISTANAGLITSSRYLLALARDENVPPFLGRISSRNVPSVALIFTTLLVIAVLFIDLKMLVGAASTVLILKYVLMNLSVIVLRESRLLNYRPVFKAPLYPWVQVIGVVGSIFLIIEMGWKALLLATGLITAGFAVYWFYGRIRKGREYALMHLTERLLGKEYAGDALEDELREIVRIRNERDFDVFDRAVQEAIVIDVPPETPSKESLRYLEKEAERLGCPDCERVAGFFRKEAEQGVDQVMPGVGISHLVVRGEDVLRLVIVRDVNRLALGNAEVFAYFLVLTSEDRRQSYVPAVAALSQIVLAEDFEKRWLTTKKKERLKDILDLGERRPMA